MIVMLAFLIGLVVLVAVDEHTLSARSVARTGVLDSTARISKVVIDLWGRAGTDAAELTAGSRSASAGPARRRTAARP